jgi:lipopolysaccharide export system protein LptA
MTRWQRRARLVIAISAVAFAIVVAVALKRRDRPAVQAPPRETEAVVEVTGGRVERFRFSREDVRVAYDRQLTFADGSTKLIDVTIQSDERGGGRRFSVAAKEGRVGQNESVLQLDGEVRLTGSDGTTVETEHASYSDKDGLVQSSGAARFARGRMTGGGTGARYDTVRDTLVILDRVEVQVAPDEKGTGAATVTARTLTFARRENTALFQGAVDMKRSAQSITADTATMHMTPDGTQIQLLELRGGSRITMDMPAPGSVQSLMGRDIDLTYAADGQTLEHAVLTGDSAIQLAATAGAAGRSIEGSRIDLTLAADGATPVVLAARDPVTLTLPAEGPAPERTIRARTMDAKGEAGRGLTQARFAENVRFNERRTGDNAVDRQATAAALDIRLKPGMAGIEDARFSRGVHFVDGTMTSDAAEGRYDLDRGTLALTGSEPRMPKPRVVNERLAVDATAIDVILEGPHLKASGMVKSVVQPASASSSARIPSMLKQDKPVNVTSDRLEYDGTSRKATYTGTAQLWQEETSLKAAGIVLDDRTGDLAADGGITTVTVRDAVTKDKKPERVRSIATAMDFRYDDAARRATYTGGAHMNSTDGDVTADRIELYLKPSKSGASAAPGDDLDRAEAYDNVTLRDRNRTTTGSRLTYTTVDQQYVVTGTPVKVIDECKRETIGRKLTYLKSADTITIDGSEQARTQTKGSGQCP